MGFTLFSLIKFEDILSSYKYLYTYILNKTYVQKKYYCKAEVRKSIIT